MVYRIYVEKRKELAVEAEALKNDIKSFLLIEGLKELRLINRYDVEGISRELFDYSVRTVFSEPQTDLTYTSLDEFAGAVLLAVEYLPGQYDQRADSAAQCVQIISQDKRPNVRTAKIYALYGSLTEADITAIKKYLINPVESREAALDEFATLETDYPIPGSVKVLTGFRQLDKNGIERLISEYGLAMDADDAALCVKYFNNEGRDPTLTELKMLDTYWSDHCRHTTFNTIIDNVAFEDPLLQKAYDEYLAIRQKLNRTKPVSLMDIATIGARYLKAEGKLDKLDESDEINACTVKIKVDVDGQDEDWLLMFKNETHNHPTEIEPFGGAATCIGGAIRDPLSGRSYVYAAMRLTGAANPLKPVSETIRGKLPQRKLVTTAAAGYSSYGNQIGLATGIVDELYHDGYAAKRMEIGAVIAAAPQKNVRREKPLPGDVVILLGGRTGRDGIGGATGSSKSHTLSSLESCGAEVQKGNAPEERKLQRLFRNPSAALMIKKCNDFGAGGVSVAVGELADGLKINLDAVTKKYEGLDGTELAISESQERMAVVVSREDAERFISLAGSENLEANIIAEVTAEPRLVMYWRGDKIVDISRKFLDTNGAEKHIDITPASPADFKKAPAGDFRAAYKELTSDLNVCSKQGLPERFDSTIGAGTVLLPLGGRYQKTPIQAMVHKIAVEKGQTEACSFMSWGYNPFISEKSPYHGAYLAVVESVSKLIATGASYNDIYLSFQEYFEKPGKDPKRWGKPLAALLGALKAQTDLSVAAIGGKDSMSGSFEDIDVPPTLVSFAVTTGKVNEVISPEFKKAGSKVVWLKPEYDEWGVPEVGSLIKIYNEVNRLIKSGKVAAAYTPGYGGAAEAVFKMCLGNGYGFEFNGKLYIDDIFSYRYGSFILELSDNDDSGVILGKVTDTSELVYGSDRIGLDELIKLYEAKLESVYPCDIKNSDEKAPVIAYKTANRPKPLTSLARPRVLIPAFPGTNCEYDTARAVRDAGAEAEIFVVKNITAQAIKESAAAFSEKLMKSQILVLPGGFSAGDEPDGSGKFITAFLRNPGVKDAISDLLDKRMGLVCGICNGFQALIKLGLVPFGKIIEADENCPTLTYNAIGRHQSKIVYTRIASNKSPWLMKTEPGQIYAVPVSHGEGRFVINDKLMQSLIENGQIATQYCDIDGNVSNDIRYNPNGSMYAVEGITSPDGRVFGKMGHCERWREGLMKNVAGEYDMRLFESAVLYYR
jgi:phosphoribosylformylglycinamidine synthase